MEHTREQVKADWIIAVITDDESPAREHYWSGSGLTRDPRRAQIFATREVAYAAWTEHSGWQVVRDTLRSCLLHVRGVVIMYDEVRS